MQLSLPLKPPPNPAVERDWPKAALFMSCGNLNFLSSRHVPWSASPSLLR